MLKRTVILLMSLSISTNGINLIKEFEGLYLNAYKCPAGVWTIGYGHTGNVKQGTTINKKEAEVLLLNDLQEFENAVNKLPYKLNQNQFDALVSFSFNCGTGNLKKLTNNNKRTLNEISNALLLYNKANGKELTGLTRRRKAEQKLFNTACPTNTNSSTVVTASKKTNLQIAKEVIQGKWGNGTIRKIKLKNAGYDYKEIQKLVNQLLK